MPRQTTLAEVEARAYRLFSNHTAIEILDVLGRGEHLHDASLRADQQAISDAVALLNQMGLVHTELTATTRSANRTLALTPRGRSLAELLEDISRRNTV